MAHFLTHGLQDTGARLRCLALFPTGVGIVFVERRKVESWSAK